MRSPWLTGAILGACLALLAPAAAGAVAPPPTVRGFDDLAEGTDIAEVYRDQGIAFSQTNVEPCGARVESFGDFAPSPPHVLGFICGATLRIDFAEPQAYVAMRVFLTEGSGGLAPLVAVPLTLDAFDAADERVATTTITAETEAFNPISVVTGDEAASIAYIAISSPTWQMDVDDVAYSDVGQPDTEITSGPATVTNARDATFEFVASVPLAGFECDIDGEVGPCGSPTTVEGLEEGSHDFTVTAIDGYGARDPSPAPFRWEVDLTPPDTRIEPPLPPPLSASPSVTIRFSSPSADVSSFGCALDDAVFSACSSPHTVGPLDDGDHRVRVRAIDRGSNRDPTPALVTFAVDLTAPATRIDSGPPALTLDTAATFTFSSPAADAAGFECALDGAGFSGCASPRRFEGLAGGAHRLQVRAFDAAGNRDPAPPAYDWQVGGPPGTTVPPPLPPDLDADGVPDTSDNCPADANAGQGDRDADGIGDECESFEQGDVPAVAGVNSLVRALAGEVYVKLPGAALRAADPVDAGLAQNGIEKGFQPLKGVASVPVGSVVDTRKGRAGISSAADFRKAADPRHRAQSATLAAGIFRIKQARKRRPKAPKRPFTDLVLASASGAQAVCATKSRTSPVKGIVRQVAATTKGRFRTVGGASTTTVIKGATFVTTDRCTGTLTEVGRGRASVFDRRLRRTVTVKAGRAYLAKARLFAAKKGRGG